MVFVSHDPSSIVALCGAESWFDQAITSPTFAWTGCGENLKSLIVTVDAAVAPASAVAQARAPPPPAPLAAAPGDSAAGDAPPPAAVAAGEVAPELEQAARVRRAATVGSRASRRMS